MQASSTLPEPRSAPPLALAPASPPELDGVACWSPVGGGPPLFLVAQDERFASIDEAVAWTRRNRDRLDALMIEHGGVVLRGFPITDSIDFDRLTGVFPPYRRGYVGGGGPRAKITGRVMESTQLSETMRLSLHSEMGYTRTFPPRIAFYCRKAAEIGGETTIGSMREFMSRMPVDLIEKLDLYGARTVRNFAPAGASRGRRVTDHPDNRGWDDAFGTEDRAEVEAHCAEMGMQPIWNEDGALTLIADLDPFEAHPVTGERVYRVQIHTNKAFEVADRRAVTEALRASQKIPSAHSLGNGEPLADEDCDTIARLYDQVTRAWPWRAGDVMILDNLLVAHGRNPYRGTRDVQVVLLDR